MKRFVWIAAAGLTVLGSNGASWALVTNGGFESGLSGWTTTGTVLAVDKERARDFLGLAQPPAGGWWTAREGTLFASLHSTNTSGSTVATLSQTFTANAGETLSFSYFFDFGDVAPFYDAAVGSLLTPTGAQTLFEYNTPGHYLGDDVNVGWRSVSVLLPDTGQYTLSFLIQDFDGTFESLLGVDMTPGQIPEPLSVVSVLSALAGLAAYARRHLSRA